ncbi:hypothetical protein SEA_ALAKAZAM_48 [Microbacterium phage Alakazam]|nr:hypothetical protein SEA_ALAKAZAM_48 [Microbacterium phage Alakazam]
MVWGFYVLAWIGALILLFAFAIGIARGVRNWFPKREPKPRKVQGQHIQR